MEGQEIILSWYVGIIILILGLTGLFGGWVNYIMASRDTAVKKEGQPAAKFRDSVAMGLAAAVLTPLFLQTIQSALIKEGQTNPLLLFPLAGICLIAAIYAPRFIGGISNILLKQLEEKVNEAEKKVQAANETAEQAVDQANTASAQAQSAQQDAQQVATDVQNVSAQASQALQAAQNVAQGVQNATAQASQALQEAQNVAQGVQNATAQASQALQEAQNAVQGVQSAVVTAVESAEKTARETASNLASGVLEVMQVQSTFGREPARPARASLEAEVAEAGEGEVAFDAVVEIEEDPAVLWSRLEESYAPIRLEPASAARTDKQTRLVRQLVDLVPKMKDFDLVAHLESEDMGERLGGFAYLYAKPDFSMLGKLVKSTRKAETFAQYWGVLAIGRLLQGKTRLDIPAAEMKALESLYAELERDKRGTDRYILMYKMMRDLE